MCGIIGYVGGRLPEGLWTESHNLIGELLVAAQSRGIDATGIAATRSRYDAQHRFQALAAKRPGSAEEFVTSGPWLRMRHQRCCSVIGHTRYSTGSSPLINANNHPFLGNAGGRPFALVHNGILSDVEETVDRIGVTMTTDTDSELACRLIEKEGSLPLGLHRCLRELKGSMAFAVLDFSTGTVWLARDGQRSLWIARLKDGKRVVFGSTAEIISQAVKRCLGKPGEWIESIYPLAAHYVHSLTPEGRLVAPYGEGAILEAG
jgi:glutamine phosphoribosylpyrophosphate amidotransferase